MTLQGWRALPLGADFEFLSSHGPPSGILMAELVVKRAEAHWKSAALDGPKSGRQVQYSYI